MKIKAIFAVIILASISSCAQPPEKIEAVQMDETQYLSLTCDQMRAQKSSYQSDYDFLAKQQNSAATADAVGVLFLGVPGASLTGGDKSTPIAVLKGKMAALQRVATRKHC